MKLSAILSALTLALQTAIAAEPARSAGRDAILPPGAAQGPYSGLWGAKGEKWSPQSRLPDFSFAGFQCGEKPIPNLAVKANVRDFGARGDGQSDDTAAFNAAIAATTDGAILVPAGRYKITGIIRVNKPNLVLRGEGPDRSVLVFPNTLTDVKPKWGATTTGKPTSNYSWGGGFVVIGGGAAKSSAGTDVVAPFPRRGDEWLAVSDATGLSPGQWIEVKVSDDSALSLSRWIYAEDPGSVKSLRPQSTRQVAKVEAIDLPGKRLRIDRPLRFDIRAEWSPKVRTFAPLVVNSGVENLGFEFPSLPYRGHFTELGANALEIANAAHCWIRNVRIANSDSGIYANGVHCTISDVVLTSARPTANKDTGHHGISVNGSDNLITRFDFQQRFIHDISVQNAGSAGNVFSNGKGRDLCFDHHKQAPFSNLFSNIDCGAGNRVWSCGGGANLGKNSGGWTTFWNLRAAKNLSYPPESFAPSSINVIAILTADDATKIPDAKWFETMSPASIIPRELHAAQLDRRLGR